MGIRGLTTYIGNNADYYFEDYNLCNTYLVIDGCSLAAQVYGTANCNDVFGGDYDKYKKAIVDVFNLFKQCQVTPIVIIDGGFEHKKLNTIKSRMKNKVDAAKNMTPANRAGQLYPLLQMEVFKDTLLEQNVKFATCDFEADDEIAAVARRLQCPVLSYDSDFFIFDVLYIPFPMCDFHPKKNRDETFYIPCKLYNVEKFLNRFSGLNKTHLPLMATILGNDYISKQTFSKFFAQLKLPHTKTNANDQQRTISAVIEWLRHETFESAEYKILARLKQDDRSYVSRLIRQSADSYKICTTNLLKYLGLEGSPADGNIPDTNLNLPQWFIDKYRCGLLPSSFMNIITKLTYLFSPQMEDLSLIHSHDISLPIVQVLFGLLTASKPRHYFTYITRNEYNAIQAYREVPIYGTDTFKVFPTLDVLIRVPRKLRYNFFVEVLKLTNDDELILAEFPNDWRLFVSCIVYWCRNIQDITITPPHIDALIMSIIYINIVDRKVGYHRSKAAFLNQNVSKLANIKKQRAGTPENDIDIENAFLADLLNNITVDDCLLVIDSFIHNFQKAEKLKTNSKLFTVKTVHCYAEFQSALRQIYYLNALLDRPMEKNSIANFYNGTFIYNMYTNLKKRNDPKEYVLLNLKGATSVIAAYKSIRRHFELLLPSVFKSVNKSVCKRSFENAMSI